MSNVDASNADAGADSSAAQVPFATTLHVRDHCLCLAAQRAARALARRFDHAFRPLGLTHGQFSLLMSLNRPAPPSIGAVAETLAMDRTTLTANLKPLERRRLLKVTVDPDDKRGRRVALTPAGHALLEKALPLWRQVLAEIESGLASGDAAGVRAGLNALAQSGRGA